MSLVICYFKSFDHASLIPCLDTLSHRPAAAGYGSEMATYDNKKLHVVNNLVQNLFNTYGGIDSGVT